jgi:hypothetical protein
MKSDGGLVAKVAEVGEQAGSRTIPILGMCVQAVARTVHRIHVSPPKTPQAT